MNYFALTLYSLFMEYFQRGGKEEEELKTDDLENNLNTPNPEAVPLADTNPPVPPVPPPPTAATDPAKASVVPPQSPVPSVNDTPINVSQNIKVTNPADEYGNYDKLGIITNVLDPRKDEQAKGITEKQYMVKMPDGKTYPYKRNEIQLFS